MRWRESPVGVGTMKAILIFTLIMICSCDGARRTAQRRQDTELYAPSPSVESLQELAQAMGAAGFEHYTEGKALVKRLIPPDNQPEDIVEYQGVIGRAGVDFPAFPNIPPTGFNCKNVPTGYYADLETDCQVFHICDTSRKISFLCPNGTIFSQSHLICDWWFKVDCASAPALYESSAEYYSNEQKKSQKITQSLSKNQDLQQIGADTNIRAESRRTPINVPSTTERLLRSRQRPTEIPKATVKTYQALFTDNFNPTQRTAATTAFEQRRKSLVQLISTNFGNIPARTTQPTYTESPVYRSTPDYSLKEMQVAAETAAFANNNNRQYLQDFHNKNYRPYPVYTPNVPVKPKAKSNPNLTTLYDFRDKSAPSTAEPTTTKRPTLIPYTKSYSTIIEKQEPYTRPGVSLLKGFLQKEKNKTLSLTTTTEKVQQVTARSDNLETEKPATGNTKDNFESATKIPHTTRADVYTQTASSDRYDVYSTTNHATQTTTEPSYQERRERLMRKLNLDRYAPTATEPTVPTTNTDKYFGDQPNRPGLVVPPSLTPKTLHSLAIYYATALDNLSTTPTPEEAETVTPAFDEYEAMEEVLPALFSRQTINKYSNLFGHQMTNAELLEEIREDPNGTYNELVEDLSVQQSQNPIATSPQIRELAQVFTHALSAYLQDPVQFRKVLSDIRPTHPSFGDLLTTTEESINTEPTTTINEEDDEILGFSDDHKALPPVSNLREPKALGFPTTYPVTEETTTPRPATEYTTPSYNSFSSLSTVRNPFRCCGRISASYTSPSTPAATTPSYTNTVAVNVNTLGSHHNEPSPTTEADYSVHKYGGFQNNALTLNDSPYGTNAVSTEGKPLSEYVEATNLPTAWGIDPSASTTNDFESKKIKATTELPPTTSVYFTETESVELENEEELQRAHSQSFAAPQGNSIRHGKQINFDAEPIKKPAEDLEAPTIPDDDLTTVQTTTQPTTTARVTETESFTTTPTASEVVFTSPDSDKSINQQSWSSTAYGNWQSTVIDPITLNDGLSATAVDQNQGLSENTYIPNTATTPTEYVATEQTAAPTVSFEVSTHETKEFERQGRLLRDSSTEPAQDLTTITDTVVEKAKEIMNATTTEKLMNVMKKTKSKTVKRLILLLIQTCDDDHNTTAEASKKALLEALMAVSQKDMEDIAKEEETTEVPTTEANVLRRADRIEKTRGDRRGKSLNFDPSAVNSLSNVAQTSTTTETAKTTEDLEAAATTTFSPLRTNTASRRGIKKFHVRTTPVEPRITTKTPFVDSPIAEARVAGPSDTKATSDTRALELLRSLYSIAARWG